MDNIRLTMTVMQEQEESGQFQNFCRMALEDFQHFLLPISDKIRKWGKSFIESIPAYMTGRQ